MTALASMAGSARPPVLDDGRIPCPLCGGLVHPVAGRCKHCKEDLAARRTGRAAANTPLPSLQGKPNPPVAGVMPQMIAAIAPNPIAVPMNGGTVLPPRVTGRGMRAEKPRASWKSWPMLVIVLASVAIIVAVVLMVWPPPAHDAGRKVVQPPAPERMETDPLPPAGAGNSNGADPWGGHSQVDPPKAPVAPRATPDPLPPSPRGQPQDPLADPFGPDPFAGGLNAQNATAMMQAVMTHACDKLKSCPNADDMTTAVCDGFKMFPKAPPPSCDAAQKCFDAIDKMDCTDDANPMSVMNMQSCMQAALSC